MTNKHFCTFFFIYTNHHATPCFSTTCSILGPWLWWDSSIFEDDTNEIENKYTQKKVPRVLERCLQWMHTNHLLHCACILYYSRVYYLSFSLRPVLHQYFTFSTVAHLGTPNNQLVPIMIIFLLINTDIFIAFKQGWGIYILVVQEGMVILVTFDND